MMVRSKIVFEWCLNWAETDPQKQISGLGGGLFPKFVGVRTMVADKGQEIVQSHTCGGLANWQILGENPA